MVPGPADDEPQLAPVLRSPTPTIQANEKGDWCLSLMALECQDRQGLTTFALTYGNGHAVES